ncbi:hypothetical protein, partial [Rhodoplanes sp. SY1]|uniref:hypothetical protein n=1 Tax=Rhodoplanes sp. SY1 TaxID=3166646 RepID=UPI0038B492FA
MNSGSVMGIFLAQNDRVDLLPHRDDGEERDPEQEPVLHPVDDPPDRAILECRFRHETAPRPELTGAPPDDSPG